MELGKETERKGLVLISFLVGRMEVVFVIFPDFRTGTPTFQKLEWKGSYEPATAVSRSIKEYHRCACLCRNGFVQAGDSIFAFHRL